MATVFPIQPAQPTGRQRRAGQRRAALDAARPAAAVCAAAAVAVHPPAVVPAQVPVLRLQLARMARHQRGRHRRHSRGRLHRCAGGRPGRGVAAHLGPHRAHHLHRRRHAQPVLAAGHRPPAGRRARAREARARLRDHAGGQPRHFRAQPLSRVPRRGRHAPVGGRAELQRRAPDGPGPRARPRAGHRRARRGRAARSTPSTST
jgi:hypothetical protein